jgi:hypothetical protein
VTEPGTSDKITEIDSAEQGQLAAELDALLAQVEGNDSNDADSNDADANANVASGAAADADDSATVNDADADDDPSPRDPAPPQTVPVGEDLADQIQQLLDGAKKEVVPPTSADDEFEEAEGAFLAPEQVLMEAANDADASQPAPRPASQPPTRPAEAVPSSASAVTPRVPVPEPADRKLDAEMIGAIDDYLSEQADDAVGGEFETVHEVLSAEAEAARLDPSRAAAHADERDESAEAGDHDDASDGRTYDDPRQVLGDPSNDDRSAHRDAKGFGATAEDVADELDDQPESQAEGDASAAGADADDVRPRPLPRLVVRGGAELARRMCAAVNRPLAQCSPQTRHLLGYFALLHVFLGSALLIGKAAASLFGH